MDEVNELIRHELIDPLFRDSHNQSGLYYSVLGGQLEMTAFLIEYFKST